MIVFDGLVAGLVVSNDGLREGDAQVLDGHLVVLMSRGDAAQVSRDVLDRLVVAHGQLEEQLLDRYEPDVVVLEATHLNEVHVQIWQQVRNKK